jgi:hypothetical protein
MWLVGFSVGSGGFSSRPSLWEPGAFSRSRLADPAALVLRVAGDASESSR